MIVLVSSTFLDGPTVRYFRTERRDAEPLITVSRNGIKLNCWLDDLDDGVLEKVKQVHQTLVADRSADVSHLATHKRQGRDFVPLA